MLIYHVFSITFISHLAVINLRPFLSLPLCPFVELSFPYHRTKDNSTVLLQ